MEFVADGDESTVDRHRGRVEVKVVPSQSEQLPTGSSAASLEASTVSDMPGDIPFAQLPDQVTLTRDEISVVLFALDVTESTELGEPDRAAVRRAIRLITRKLWPELGDLLDDEGEG